MLKKIISGGQTGVDRAAIDAAIDCGFTYGGFVPAGRKAEDGEIPLSYKNLEELKSPDYFDRTAKNIETSDGTVVIHSGKFGKGTGATVKYALKIGKPLLELNLSDLGFEKALSLLKKFIEENGIEILNVAGPRASIDPSVYSAVYSLLKTLLCS